MSQPQPPLPEEQATQSLLQATPSEPSPRSDSGGVRRFTFAPGDLAAGRYRVVRFVAQGGMGEVYEVEDQELGERVALKTIRPEVAHEGKAIDRFKREIQLARVVTHPNVCRIFDLGVHRPPEEASLPEVVFLTMELLGGETLARRLRRQGRISEAEALPLVRQMTGALAAAHAAGVVHRDFKSSNVVLMPGERRVASGEQRVASGEQRVASGEQRVASGEQKAEAAGQSPASQTLDEAAESPLAASAVRVVVTDFGLARGSGMHSGTSLTGEAMVGTPAYMAPEQVEGGEVTAAADIYALGVVLYEMLTGQLPFVGQTPLSTAIKRLKERPAPPTEHVPALDRRWASAILRCLEPVPEDRFGGALDVLRAVQGEAVAPSRRQLRRRRRMAVVLAGVLTASAAAGVGSWLGHPWLAKPGIEAWSGPAGTRRAVAVLGFKNLSGREEAAWLTTALSEMLSTELAAGEELRIVSGENVARMRMELGLGEEESYSPETLARIRRNVGADLVVLGSYLALGSGADASIRLDVRVQRTGSAELVASVSETGRQAQLFDLVSRVGSGLRGALGVGASGALPAAVPMKAEARTGPEALELRAAERGGPLGRKAAAARRDGL
jgi:eukaryotic-like serine/threonine-protein kinase